MGFTEIDDPLTGGFDSIGERIRAARKAAGLNQAELALRVGVSQPAVANWEAGVHDPRRLMLAKLAESLDVKQEWLASGARSRTEVDKQPAAAYLRRPLQHTPLISYEDAVRLLSDAEFDPHTVAQDYIPVTYGAHDVFALFIADEAMNLAFPRDTLVVIDYSDRNPSDGAFCLVCKDGFPALRRWRNSPPRLEPWSSDPTFRMEPFDDNMAIIGCVRYSIRFH